MNIEDCTCHATCKLCGYRKNEDDPLPDTENDCLSCADESEVPYLEYGNQAGTCHESASSKYEKTKGGEKLEQGEECDYEASQPNCDTGLLCGKAVAKEETKEDPEVKPQAKCQTEADCEGEDIECKAASGA